MHPHTLAYTVISIINFLLYFPQVKYYQQLKFATCHGSEWMNEWMNKYTYTHYTFAGAEPGSNKWGNIPAERVSGGIELNFVQQQHMVVVKVFTFKTII